MNKIELLAPAGDLERLKWAFRYGADAVYLGGEKFSLRSMAKNFTLDEIKEGVEFAHNLNKKVYVTVNIVFHEDDIEDLVDYLKKLEEYKVDAIIASDMFILDLLKENNINLEFHLSTQSSCLNKESAKFFKKEGVKRVVLARECSKNDIVDIIKSTGIDTEVFIHGAMCMGYSGRCALSNYMTNRDSNRGACAQICRWVFESGNNPDFTLMSKDLNMVGFIEDMMNIGIDSFKIEGRMRSIYYIATVCMCYRRIIDGIKNKTLNKKELNYYSKVLDRVANRDTAPQFYNKFPGVDESYFNDRVEESNQDFLGIVLNYDDKEGIVTIEERNYFKIGDIVEFIGPNMEEYEYTIKEIINEDNECIDAARHPKEILRMHIPIHLDEYSMMRLKVIDKKSVL